VDITIYLQGRERREQQAGCLGAEPRCIGILKMELDSLRSLTHRKLEHRLLPEDFRCEIVERLRHTEIEIELAHHALRREAEPRRNAPGRDAEVAALLNGVVGDAEALEGRG